MSSDHNTITGNTISNNNEDGIFLRKSSDNTITGNTITNNNIGILINYDSWFNTISESFIVNNSRGIECRHSKFNVISKCTIMDNKFKSGFYSSYSNFTIFFCNNFIDNFDDLGLSHYHGFYGDKNFFFRNYWSGRKVTLPCPYLVQINIKSFDRLFPLKPITFNWDWFPKATPYNYDYESDWRNT